MAQRRHPSSARAILLGLAITAATVGAFASPLPLFAPLSPPRVGTGRSRNAAAAALASSSSSSGNDVVVISPPGGIGEIASVEAARLGGSVRWFVVSAPATAPGSSAANDFKLTAETLDAISRAGGSMELAGADAASLLSPPGEEDDGRKNTALAAIASWLGTGSSSVGAVICTYDGAVEERARADRTRSAEEIAEGIGTRGDDVELIRDGIRVAAREIVDAGRVTGGKKRIALLAAGEEIDNGTEEDGGDNKGGGGFLSGLFGGNEVEIPGSLDEALGGATTVIRYGELFGAAESSPESSPFMGGPRRDPTVREMYTQRSVRIDPTVAGGDATAKSNRLALGEAASRLGLGRVDTPAEKMDVSLSSFAGTDAPTEEDWNAQFARIAEMTSGSNAASSAYRLYSAEFSGVPSTKRLAEWIATKWAPAILRSYDIAGTRVGARPVYAVRTDDDTVEIVWQELVNFESVTSGRMIIEIDEGGLVASRGGEYFGEEAADAASQAVEKGLAMKPQAANKKEEPAKVVTNIVSTPPPVVAKAAAPAEAAGPGPRSAGARRSAERSRGGRRRKPSSGGGES
eukprot:CAMPEP_0181138690 /NCGR_PEP_ID=MMETSP1071-20121207/34380_1 /TAXON_ID=35127 /ORGANISM="Thalassiosira sp., Strain NH16" /LENGTH=574 /DNA_ID=CAMNT_0023225541 /DNA_START=116 /DNA_END=1841 /DNA_ORIENTATION=+